VKLIPAQFVKPYLKGNKNDAADAEAITEAASRPNMRYVPIKTNWHLDIQAIHRIRDRLVRSRTALCNEIRAFLFEYGIVIPKSVAKLRAEILKIQAGSNDELSPMARTTLADLHSELLDTDERISACEIRLKSVTSESDLCRRLQTIRGIGELTATALIAAVPEPAIFKNGRQFSAWIGLVPRHTGTGGQNKILGISKRGNGYLRRLLIHGSRSIVLHSGKRQDKVSKWAVRIKEERGYNKACIAMANKIARIVWSVMTKGTEFQIAA
jgi:transposase